MTEWGFQTTWPSPPLGRLLGLPWGVCGQWPGLELGGGLRGLSWGGAGGLVQTQSRPPPHPALWKRASLSREAAEGKLVPASWDRNLLTAPDRQVGLGDGWRIASRGGPRRPQFPGKAA